jgi:acyl dehydratase
MMSTSLREFCSWREGWNCLGVKNSNSELELLIVTETILCNAGSRFLSSVSRDVVSSEEKRKEVVAATTGLAQGDKFGMDRCFTAADVSAYVKLCGDTNPIHSCESTAQSAGFRGRVVHGMLYAGLFPAIIGSQFAGAVYVSQSLQFRAPLLVGEPVCAEVEVTGITKLRHHYR